MQYLTSALFCNDDGTTFVQSNNSVSKVVYFIYIVELVRLPDYVDALHTEVLQKHGLELTVPFSDGLIPRYPSVFQDC